MRDSATRRPSTTHSSEPNSSKSQEPLTVDEVSSRYAVSRSSLFSALSGTRLPSRRTLVAMVRGWDPRGEEAVSEWMERRRVVDEGLAIDVYKPEQRRIVAKDLARPPAAESMRTDPDMCSDPRLARLRLGQMLTGLAKKRGIITKALAYDCSISYSTASGILRGATRPSDETLARILGRLNASREEHEKASSLLKESRTVRQFDVSVSDYEYIVSSWSGDLEGWQRTRDQIFGRG
jgi:transcriptional regulator with XRE-family HTH domain/predicted DNA-binding transcriptional regulator AlpA